MGPPTFFPGISASVSTTRVLLVGSLKGDGFHEDLPAQVTKEEVLSVAATGQMFNTEEAFGDMEVGKLPSLRVV